MLKNALYSMFSVGRGLLFRRKLAEGTRLPANLLWGVSH